MPLNYPEDMNMQQREGHWNMERIEVIKEKQWHLEV